MKKYRVPYKKRVPYITTNRVDAKGKVYEVPSVTTIIKYLGDNEGLTAWAIRETFKNINWEKRTIGDYKESTKWYADIGTTFHEHVESVLLQRDPDLISKGYDQQIIDEIAYCVADFKQWESRHKLTDITVEKRFVSDEYEIGGTVDLLACVDGINEVIDFKTGAVSKWKHKLQVVAYMKIVNNVLGEDRYTQGRIVYCHRSKNIKLTEIIVYPDEVDMLWRCMKAAHFLYINLFK
jgi:hypothetical protein